MIDRGLHPGLGDIAGNFLTINFFLCQSISIITGNFVVMYTVSPFIPTLFGLDILFTLTFVPPKKGGLSLDQTGAVQFISSVNYYFLDDSDFRTTYRKFFTLLEPEEGKTMQPNKSSRGCTSTARGGGQRTNSQRMNCK